MWHIGILGALGRLIDKDTSTMSEDAAYIVLDVPSNITSKALKKHFRNISLTYHPDKHPGWQTYILEIFSCELLEIIICEIH